MNIEVIGVNKGNILEYQSAIKKLSAEQAVLALATKGANSAQIEEIMTTETAIFAKGTYTQADIQAALAKNGLASSVTILNSTQQKEIVQSGLLTSEKLSEIAATLGLTTAENGSLVVKKSLNLEMVKQQLESIGVVGATQKQILAILGLNTAEGGAITGTNVLTASFTKLWSVISAHPIGAIVTALGALVVGIATATSISNKAKEEARKISIELTNAYVQEKESLDSQIEKYKELKETLDNGNVSTDEARSIKEQLLEIQQSLIESYGNEASNIDLVNGKYREQLGLLSELSKEKASDYVKENRAAYENAKEELEKTRTYKIGSIFSYNSKDGMSDEQKELYEYVKSYSDLFEIRSMYDTLTFSNSDYAPTLFVNANADEAKEVIDQFYDDIEKYIKENNLSLDYDSLQIDLSAVSSDIETNDALKEHRKIYDEFMKAEVIRSDTLRPLYQQSIQAVEDYNKALSTGEGVEEAKANLDSVQQSVKNATGELEGSQDVFDSIYNGINKDAEAAYSLDQAFKNNEEVKKYAEQLRGLQDFDLKAMKLNGENALSGLMNLLNLTSDDVDLLISKLVELGYVQGKIENPPSTTFEPFDVEDFKSTLNQIQSGYQSLIDAKKEYTDNGGFLSLDTIASLTESGLITYLEQTENGIRFNTDAYLENAEIMKQNAIMQLYNAMCHDVEAIAIGNVGELSPIANKAIAELGNSAETAANQAANSAKGWYEYGASVAFANNSDVQGATGTTKKQIEATIAAYQNVARMIDNIDIAKSVKPKGSSSKKENTKEKLLKEGKEFLDKYLTLYRAELDAGMIDFNTFIDKSRAIIEKFYKDAKISGKDYFDSLKSLYETQLSLYDKVLSAVSKRFDKEIQKYQDMIDAVNKQNEALEKQKEDYNGILDAIDSVYEKEIERIESEKQAIQDQIDAIQDEADAYEQLKQKEEALYNLERAQSQRTKKVYTEQKGYIYTQDGEAIRDAQDSLNDIETESKINDLQKQQDALDETIDKLNEYKDKWAEIPEAHQNALNKELALAMFGKDFEKLILENRITDIEAFKDKYVAAEQQIQDNTLLIESYEEKIAYYEGLKEQWSQISSAYEEEAEKQIAAMFLGEDWEQKILSGRLDTLNDFKDEYRRIQQEITNLAWESANAQIKAAEEAKKGANGTPGSTTLTNSSNTNNLKKNPAKGGDQPISMYAKGGVLREAKPAHPIFEKLAREMGEDHIATIAFKEGERILTPEQNQLFENTVKNIFPNLEKMINISEAKPFVPNPSALNKQRVEITQNINVTLPNITNETGFENFKKEMDTFKLQAYQFANRRYR